MPKPRKATAKPTAKPQPALSDQSQETDEELEEFVDERALALAHSNESDEEAKPADHKRRSMPRPEVLDAFKKSIMPDKFSADDHRKKRDAKQEREKNKLEREKSKLGRLTVHTYPVCILVRHLIFIKITQIPSRKSSKGRTITLTEKASGVRKRRRLPRAETPVHLTPSPTPALYSVGGDGEKFID